MGVGGSGQAGINGRRPDEAAMAVGRNPPVHATGRIRPTIQLATASSCWGSVGLDVRLRGLDPAPRPQGPNCTGRWEMGITFGEDKGGIGALVQR